MGDKGPSPPKFLENIVILCFERRFSKQNSVIRLKSNILAPQNFWAGYAIAPTDYFLKLQPHCWFWNSAVKSQVFKFPLIDICFVDNTRSASLQRQVAICRKVTELMTPMSTYMILMSKKERGAYCQLAKWLKVSAIRERPVQLYFDVFGLGTEGQGFVIVPAELYPDTW